MGPKTWNTRKIHNNTEKELILKLVLEFGNEEIIFVKNLWGRKREFKFHLTQGN